MKKAICTLRGETPVTFGKYHDTPKLNKELPKDYELRTWREKVHYDKDGNVFIPGGMIANCIRESAKFMSKPIPGKGKSTYTKHFDAGIIIQNNIPLPVKKEDLNFTDVHVPVGQSSGGARVMKRFPIIHEWEGTINVVIGDDIITADVFEEVIRNAGALIGIGTWRPRNRGMNGRFELVNMEWVD
jgi:hypothetical protein